jgi:lysyl-tRNA synthetase class 1
MRVPISGTMRRMKLPETNYWLDIAAREILDHYPSGEIVVSSGISPSASYHIGHFREIMTADALTWRLRLAGREARHVHIVDNFDPLRKRYDFLPEKFEAYVGWPISLVPDPFEDCAEEHKTYAEHFYREFETYARAMGVFPDVVVRSYEDLYANGRMAENIEIAIEKASSIRRIMKEVSHRDLPEDWLPLQLLGPNKSFTELKFASIEPEYHEILATDEAGTTHRLNYATGEAKLTWRLDWPARWEVLGVKVEPFSAQEHGAAGGSYATGERFCREIFGYEPPIPGVEYANVHLLGDTKKMSSSKGNLITPAQALEIIPPEVLRYFIVRSKPERTLYWDSADGLYNLIDEFAAVERAHTAGEGHEFMDAYLFATSQASPDEHEGPNRQISSIPFKHLVAVFQTVQGQPEATFEVLERTGYGAEVDAERSVITSELRFVAHWLKTYAPESVKFSLQKKIPQVELSEAQAALLHQLATAITTSGDLSAEAMHLAVYAAADATKLKPSQAFQAIYRVLLGQDSGPKAGWFLASLVIQDKQWLVERLNLIK